MPAVRFIVTGRVQGVGFRAHVLQIAEGLDLKGEVWNRVDGRVETVAVFGDQETVEEFELALRDGPGRVVSVDRSPAPDFDYEGFNVGPTR